MRAAPAKVNLALHVTGRRPDGYHLIESVVVFADHGDSVAVAPAEADSFTVAGPFAADVPLDGSNLVLRARDMLRGQSGGGQAFPVDIRLEKRLPVASGVGGGSADAAAVLEALAETWGTGSRQDLAAMALRLGADVPMCLVGAPLVARGIGEQTEPLDGLPSFAIVLVNPGVPVRTADVFGALASRQNPPLPAAPRALHADAVLGWLRECRNDLQAAAIGTAPEIGEALDALDGAGARLARMSGSGATCFGIFASDEAARAAADSIGDAFPHWFVVATRTGQSEGNRNGRT